MQSQPSIVSNFKWCVLFKSLNYIVAISLDEQSMWNGNGSNMSFQRWFCIDFNTILYHYDWKHIPRFLPMNTGIIDVWGICPDRMRTRTFGSKLSLPCKPQLHLQCSNKVSFFLFCLYNILYLHFSIVH